MKCCTRCKTEKEDTSFRIRYDKRGSGSKSLSYLNNICRKCDSEISNKNYFHKKDNPEFKAYWLKKSRDYYHKNKEIIKAKNKARRLTPEYKEMMRKYRDKNKNKILKQEIISKRRYQQKHRDGLTDEYIIGLLKTQELANRETLKIHPEIIQAKRIQLMIIRKIKNNAKNRN